MSGVSRGGPWRDQSGEVVRHFGGVPGATGLERQSGVSEGLRDMTNPARMSGVSERARGAAGPKKSGCSEGARVEKESGVSVGAKRGWNEAKAKLKG